MRNSVAVSPELSGVTYVQGSRGVWGMPHVLQMIDNRHLESMRAVVAANEECLHADGEQSAAHDGTDYVVNVWVGLSGPAVLAGKLYRWGQVLVPLELRYFLLDPVEKLRGHAPCPKQLCHWTA